MNGELQNKLYYLDFSAASPAENLAVDEILLTTAEEGRGSPVLRFWESTRHFFVLGCGSSAAKEVDLPLAADRGIPVLRRISGGCTVVQGPGSLNYSLILPISCGVDNIVRANSFIMNKNKSALQRLVPAGMEIEIAGATDLCLGSRKFSGNSQRRLRKFLLFHGTILYRFDLPILDEILPLPPRQPDYRRMRPHTAFLVNFPCGREALIEALKEEWQSNERMEFLYEKQAGQLAADKYAQDRWNLKI